MRVHGRIRGSSAAGARRQLDDEAGAPIGWEFRFDAPAMHLDDLMGYIESQPHAGAMVVPMRPVEALEEMGAMFRGDAQTIVADGESDSVQRLPIELDVDLTTLRAELDGVVEEVHDNLLKAKGIESRR
jgi:hypothetical protein